MIVRFLNFESELLREELRDTDSKKKCNEIKEKADEFYDELVHYIGQYIQSGDTEYILAIYEEAMYYLEEHKDPSVMCSMITMVSSFLGDEMPTDENLSYVYTSLAKLSVSYKCMVSTTK